MTEEEVINLMKERMLKAEVPILHRYRLRLGEDGLGYLNEQGG